MKYAYITESTVREVVQTSPYSLFQPNYASQFAEVPDEVMQGWIVVDGVFSAPVPHVSLPALREAKNDEINAERERRTFDTFEHQGKAVSCDTLSRSDIDGINGYAALNGAFPAIWPGAWKCADNTYLLIASIEEWKAFYGSMVAAGSALYAHAQELKAQLATATTADEIAAIHW